MWTDAGLSTWVQFFLLPHPVLKRYYNPFSRGLLTRYVIVWWLPEGACRFERKAGVFPGSRSENCFFLSLIRRTSIITVGPTFDIGILSQVTKWKMYSHRPEALFFRCVLRLQLAYLFGAFAAVFWPSFWVCRLPSSTYAGLQPRWRSLAQTCTY